MKKFFGAVCIVTGLITVMLNCGDVGTDPYDADHPRATIIIPEDSTRYVYGTVVSFLGLGIAQDGDTLTGDALTWHSSLNGDIGTGTSCSAETLREGTHEIRLLVTDGDTNMAQDRITIFINGDSTGLASRLKADILSPYDNAIFTEGDTVRFSGTGTATDGDTLTGSALVWYSDEDGEIGAGTSFKSVALTPNTHKITLMAVESETTVAIASITITVNGSQNRAPTAYFELDSLAGTVRTVFHANASGCTDAQDPTADLQVRWDWGNTGTFGAWSKTKTAAHTFTDIGTHTVLMEVQDTDGLTDSYQLQVTVGNTAPSAGFQVIPGTGDTTTSFSVDASDCSDLEDQVEVLEVRWDWEGDGTWDTFWSTGKTGSHTYGTAGTKSLTLEVRDSGGLRDTLATVIVVD